MEVRPAISIRRRLIKQIARTWSDVRPVRPVKVVGVGLPKTGTTTLGYCFRRFGYKHRGYDMDLALQAKRNQLSRVLAETEKYEAFEDWPWFMVYKEIDERFPGSKFILTIRKDTETYVRSLRGHHEREGIRNKDFVKPYWWDEVHGVAPDQWDYEKSAKRYETHNRDVLEYFRARPNDFLVVCWENGDGWAELSNFLNRRCPDEAFPHLR